MPDQPVLQRKSITMPTANNPSKAPIVSNQPLGSRALPGRAQAQLSPNDGVIELSRAVRNLCDQFGNSADSRPVLFAVCLILIEEMMSGQPTTLRQIWATKLYQLADALAAEGDAPRT
jgi:hypothetical protein